MAKNNLIDIELIKQYVDITEEELMMRLVKDAVGLQKEAERNKRRKEMQDRLADPDFRKYVLMFWCDYKYMSQYFTDDEIVAAAARYLVCQQKSLFREQDQKENLLVTVLLFTKVRDILNLQNIKVPGRVKSGSLRLFIL